jgi:hypothetical protein
MVLRNYIGGATFISLLFISYVLKTMLCACKEGTASTYACEDQELDWSSWKRARQLQRPQQTASKRRLTVSTSSSSSGHHELNNDTRGKGEEQNKIWLGRFGSGARFFASLLALDLPPRRPSAACAVIHPSLPLLLRHSRVCCSHVRVGLGKVKIHLSSLPYFSCCRMAISSDFSSPPLSRAAGVILVSLR